MTNGIENKLKFAQGTLGVRMKRGEQQQTVDLPGILGRLGVDLTSSEDM